MTDSREKCYFKTVYKKMCEEVTEEVCEEVQDEEGNFEATDDCQELEKTECNEVAVPEEASSKIVVIAPKVVFAFF